MDHTMMMFIDSAKETKSIRARFGKMKKSTPNKCADCGKLMGRYSADYSKFSFITLLKLAEYITA